MAVFGFRLKEDERYVLKRFLLQFEEIPRTKS